MRHNQFFSPYPLLFGRTLVILSFVARIRAPDVLAAAVNFATPPFFLFAMAVEFACKVLIIVDEEDFIPE